MTEPLRATCSFVLRCSLASCAFFATTTVVAATNGTITTSWGDAAWTGDVTTVDCLWRWLWHALGLYQFRNIAVPTHSGTFFMVPGMSPGLATAHTFCMDLTILLPGAVVALLVYRMVTRLYAVTRCENCAFVLKGLTMSCCPHCGNVL